MNHSRLCAARALSTSATIQITIQIALFASLAFCGLPQRTAFGAAQIQSTRPRGHESQDEVRKPPSNEDQARMAEIRGRLPARLDSGRPGANGAPGQSDAARGASRHTR